MLRDHFHEPVELGPLQQPVEARKHGRVELDQLAQQVEVDLEGGKDESQIQGREERRDSDLGTGEKTSLRSREGRKEEILI